MKTMNKVGAVLCVVGALTLGGCGTMNPFNPSSSGTGSAAKIEAGSAFAGYGVVQSIDVVPGSGGKEIYRFTIRMDNGARQTLTHATTAGYSVGDRVRIDNGFMQRG